MYAHSSLTMSASPQRQPKQLKSRLVSTQVNQVADWSQSSKSMLTAGKVQGVIIGATALNSPPTPAPTPDNMANTSTPAINDSIINRRADPAQGLYQTCLTLRERLRDVPDFEKFLQPPEDAQPDMPEDPVTQLWRCFRMGSSLCVLFNATRPVELIRDERLSPNLRTMNDCKAATFHFLKGIKNELDIQGDDAFMIHNLYSDDTNGFVKVTKTVTKILDILRERNLLLNRGESGADSGVGGANKMPLDNRARVVQEMVDTERKYVQDLENLQDYMRCLESNEVVSRDLIHNLFLNLNGLVDFQRRFLIRVETQNELSPEQQNWGSLFVQYEKSFSVYEPYASNFNMAQNLAVQERDKLEKFPHPVLDNFTAFLIKPVQRVTKYPLLLRDLIKHTDPIAAEEQQLGAGLAAIERIAQQINEAIRRSENAQQVKDLEGRVEDWKGHKLDHFGELLLHGQFSVIKGDQKGEVEREYYIYLFERILLCCKELGVGKKGAKPKAKYALGPNAQKTKLQLKGRIFMQNVTDVISLARNGSYTLQIFWKGDPGVENFKIKHPNEEGLQKWKQTLQKQTEQYQRIDTPGGNRIRSGGTPAATQFQWMSINGAEEDYGRHDSDTEDDHDDPTTLGYRGTGLNAGQRNGSSSNLRSRSGTIENIPPNAPGQSSYSRPPPSRYPHPAGHNTPPLTVNTNPIYNVTNSPGRNDASYFSPVETPLTSRVNSTSSQQYPFPRYPASQYSGDDPNRYTPPNMSRTSSREGQPPVVSSSYSNSFHGSQRMQRPSLPGLGSSSQSITPVQAAQQNRMRSASSPNIHHVPASSQMSRGSPGGMIPPMPTLPTSYGSGAYPNGEHISRNGNGSPTSPPMTGINPRTGSPAIIPLSSSEHGPPKTPNGSIMTTSSGASIGSKSQVKVKIHYNNDKLAIIVPYSIAYTQLLDRIERKVRICGNGPEISPTSPIRIKYRDEDGDLISMHSDDDVQMAFDVGCEHGQTDAGGTCGAVTLYVSVG